MFTRAMCIVIVILGVALVTGLYAYEVVFNSVPFRLLAGH